MKRTRHKKSLLRIYDLLYQRFGPRKWWPADTRLEIIVGAILTQNTSWANVEKAIANLKKAKALDLKQLSRTPKKRLAGLIRPAGYYNIKADRLKNFLTFLDSAHKNSLEKMLRQNTRVLRNELLSINGIGPETADSILLYAGKKPVFVVDAYTKRIFSRHRYINEDADYDQVQRLFMENLAPNVRLFNEFHALIVELGKNVCKSKKPLCGKCPIRRERHD
ncbi:MAG: endonuclease III domain-containing protein [Candidatus Gorgyraea atricola]|nr:endonuclease III domain-containing protein [Candidatus Gorgyraea atricola]